MAALTRSLSRALRAVGAARSGPPRGPAAAWAGRGLAADASPKEAEIAARLKEALATDDVQVQDTSGGCGSMYSISISSPEFVGKNTVQQHKLVTGAIQDEIKQWHGFTLNTRVPGK